MKKTVLRPKKGEMNESKDMIKKNKIELEGYLDSDLEEPENKRIYENVINRMKKKEINILLSSKENNKERNNRYKDIDKKGEKKLRRKTVERGGKYNNIQSRYIIYSKKDIEFHIMEPTKISLDKPPIYNKNNIIRKEPKGKVKVSYKSSCDHVKIRDKNKNRNKGKTIIYYHCAEINQKDLEKIKLKKQNQNQTKIINNINLIKIPNIKDDILDNKIDKKKEEIKLNEEDIIKIIESILFQITLKEKKYPENIYINEVEKYLLKKEEENKIKEIINIIKILNKEDSEDIINILSYILKNNEYIQKLKEKLEISNENIEKLLEEYKKEDNIIELDTNKIEEITENIMIELMKEFSFEENEKRIDIINKAANTIINLNKNDQEKIICALNNVKKNEYQKENINKLIKLIENLNYMRFYLFNINKNHLLNNNKDDLDTSELDNIKNNVKTQILNDNKNIDKIAFRISTLSNKDQNKILKEINKNVNEYDNNSRKSINELNHAIKNIKLIKMFSSVMNKRIKSKKIKEYDENKIKELTYSINDKLNENRNPTNWTEKLLIDKNKERKIQNLAESLNIYDENISKKTLKYLTKSVVNDEQKNNINMLKKSLMMNSDKNNSNKNIFSNQYYMINSLNITDLTDKEINILVETFSKDLFNEEIIDINQKEENLNLIANLIKELDEENQIKIIEKLEKLQEAKNDENIMKELKDKIIKLNLLKDELKEKKEENIIDNVDFFEEEDLIENTEDDLDETMTVEISTDGIEEDDIKEICQVFNVDYNNNNLKEKNSFKGDNISLKLSQQKIKDKFIETIKKEEEKQNLEDLVINVKKLDNWKKKGMEIINKNEKSKKNLEKEIDDILKLNNNGKKRLDNEDMNKLINELIDIYNKINIDFDKNELIKNFITKTKAEEKIWNKAGKINSLSDEDQKFVLNEMKNVINNDKDKIEVYEKLSQYMEIIKKIKNLKNNFEIKRSNLIQFDDCNINPEKLNEKLEIYLKILNKENIKKEDINKIVNEIINFDEEKQEYFIKNFREKITTNNKEFIMKQIEQILNKKKIQKKFAYKVLEKYIKNVIIEQEKNEKKYGIYINNEDKNETLLIKKLKELNKDKFNELKNYIIEDLNRINEISEKEKELEEIIDVINSLNTDDKIKILEEIKNNKLFNEIIEILEKREKKYNEEKKERKKVAFKEIEEKRKNDENNLLYSLVNSITEKNDSLDLESNDNKENIKHKFTIFKGNLETVEIY